MGENGIRATRFVRTDRLGKHLKINKKDIKQSERGTIQTHYEKVIFFVFHGTIIIRDGDNKHTRKRWSIISKIL